MLVLLLFPMLLLVFMLLLLLMFKLTLMLIPLLMLLLHQYVLRSTCSVATLIGASCTRL